MPKSVRTLNKIPLANESTLTLVASTLNQSPKNSRKFHLDSQDDERALNDYLLNKSLPRLIIKIIGTNHERKRYSVRASIHNAFELVLHNLMQKTHIWLFNGTRAMIDLQEEGHKWDDVDQNDPYVLTCESFGKSQLFFCHTETYQYIDRILFQIQQTSAHIPIIALLVEGDVNRSVTDIIENLTNHIPTIILKGTGAIANQLAELYHPTKGGWKRYHKQLFSDEILNEKELRRLNPKVVDDHQLIFVCQPGRDELDDSLLQAIGVAMTILDHSRVHITKSYFAMKWNKIEYAQKHILNYHTIINWTNNELDKCLEMAILFNAVSFVELLFEYGASLQRLALNGNPDVFKLKSERRRRSDTIELMIEIIPVITQLDADKRMQAYLRNLFNWTVENQYFELVMSICTRLGDPITAILLVCQWCQYKENNDYLTVINYRKHRRQFERYAADILDLCYRDNQEKTLVLLDEKSTLYTDQQPSILIDDLCSKTLVSSQCMQTYMNNIWYGDQFHMEKNFTWELLICLVCLCPLLLFIPTIRNRVFQWDRIDHSGGQSNSLRKKISYQFEPFRQFFQRNAMIRFRYNVVSYIAFLILFSYVILFDYFPLNIYHEKRSKIFRLPIPLPEIFLHVFLASIALEEMRQIYLHVKSVSDKSPYWKFPHNNRHRNTVWSFYRSDPWNILDFVAFTLWIVGFITRFIVRDHAFEVSKICMSLDLCLWYMRCLHVFLASDKLGPKLLMIFHTMRDLMSFLFFILIFLFAYTITSYALISTSSFVQWSDSTSFTTTQNGPNSTAIETLRNIIEWGTWRIFGSVSLSTSDTAQVKYTVNNDAYGFVTLLLTIAFLVIAYVLLLNNLIALFNFTIQHIHGESRQAWCYHFYVVLREYEEKDMFIPPLNLLLFPLSYYLRKNASKDGKSQRMIETNDRDRGQFQRHQQRIAEKYWKEKQIVEKKPLNQQVYVCRDCQRSDTEFDSNQLTFF